MAPASSCEILGITLLASEPVIVIELKVLAAAIALGHPALQPPVYLIRPRSSVIGLSYVQRVVIALVARGTVTSVLVAGLEVAN